MKRIHISRGSQGKYNNPWLRAKLFSEKLDAYFMNIRCPECEVDNYLAKCLGELFNQEHKQIVVYLEGYFYSDFKIRQFIDKYLNAFDFPTSIIVLEETKRQFNKYV